uniref:HIRAN domain-containing protein n=1 Tax=Spirosoma sp. SC4-14 TaxID=3128900 RepID=UPI00403F1995
MTAFNTSIAGINHYAGPYILDSISIDEPLTLVREPDNSVDPDAVQIFYKKHKLGYIPAYRAQTIARIIDRGGYVAAKLIRSGSDGKHLYAAIRVFESELPTSTPNAASSKSGCMGALLFTIILITSTAFWLITG